MSSVPAIRPVPPRTDVAVPHDPVSGPAASSVAGSVASCLTPEASHAESHAILLDHAIEQIALSSPILADIYRNLAHVRDRLWSVWGAEPEDARSVAPAALHAVTIERTYHRKHCVPPHKAHARAFLPY